MGKVKLSDMAPSKYQFSPCETALGTFDTKPLDLGELTSVLVYGFMAAQSKGVDVSGVEASKKGLMSLATALPEVVALVIAHGTGEPDKADKAAELTPGVALVLFDDIYEKTIGSGPAERDFWMAVGRRALVAAKDQTKSA